MTTFPTFTLGTTAASTEPVRRVTAPGAVELRAVVTLAGTTPSVPIEVAACSSDAMG